MERTRLEIITEEIAKKGGYANLHAAWQYLRSVSAKSEAELISLSFMAQREVTRLVGVISPDEVKEYKTDKTIKRATAIFEKMIANAEQVARRMVMANILSGKIGSIEKSNLSGKALLNAIRLNDADRHNIDRGTNLVVSRLQSGVSMTLASLKNTLHNTSIKANMIPPDAPKQKDVQKTESDKKAEEKEQKENDASIKLMSEDVQKESVVDNTDNVDLLEASKAEKKYIDKPPTKKELTEIRKNPLAYASKQTNQNVGAVNALRIGYQRIKQNDPLNSKEARDKAIEEAKKSGVARLIFEMNETIRTKGLSAFTDRGGRVWSMENYCAMITRSSAQQTTNMGEVFAHEEHDLYYIVPHSGSCPICKKFEGKVYSRSGKNPKYPPLASAFSKIDPNGSDDLDNTYWTIHPNCRHKIIRFYERTLPRSEREYVQQLSNQTTLTPEQQKQLEYYKKREVVKAERDAAMREFKQYLQVIPWKETGNFIQFYEHKKNNDAKYKALKRRYKELTTKK